MRALTVWVAAADNSCSTGCMCMHLATVLGCVWA